MKMFMLCVLVLFTVAACGVEGPPGKTGADGRAGRDGSGLKQSIRCGKFFVMNPQTALAASLTYDIYMFADGSTMVDCEASNSNTSGTGVEFNLPGKGVPRCTALIDFDGDRSGGFWEFTLPSTNQGIATYRDLTSPYNGIASSLDCGPM